MVKLVLILHAFSNILLGLVPRTSFVVFELVIIREKRNLTDLIKYYKNRL